ncbi:MAG: hypothetical protein IT458_20510 [Planctomycetes bacterium]|nr:hypothetical protein [Planctomycetota bacterium]
MLPRLLPLVLLGALAACDCDEDYSEPLPRLAAIEVETYDPVTNLVWENMGVRIISAYQEWAGQEFRNPAPVWFLTGPTGRVYLDMQRLAEARVGFQEDADGNALLRAGPTEDQAWVLLEIGAQGFTSVFAEVELAWYAPQRFVSVPIR